MLEPLDYDALRGQIPAYFYKRLNLNARPQEYFIIPIDYGYTYLLRSIRTKWSWKGGAIEIVTRNELEIFFIQQIADRTLQNQKYPARLISTPGESEVLAVPVPPPAVPDANPPPFGINFTATPVKNNIILNYYYQHREDLDLRLYINPVTSSDGYVDMLLIGYYIPDKNLELWE